MRVFSFVLGACIALAGCDEVGDMIPDLPRIGGAQEDATAQGIRTLALLGGDVRVRGPEGYCIDQGASHARRGFAVLAGCALLSEEAAIMPVWDGLVMVQFGDTGTASVEGSEAALAALLESDAGPALLATGNTPDSIEVLDVRQSDGIVLLRFEDSAEPVVDGTAGPIWRGFQDIEGRLVTVTVRSFDRAPLSADRGRALIEETMRILAEVNALPADAET